MLTNIDCGYSLEPPRRVGSNENPQYNLSRSMKNMFFFFVFFFFFFCLSENVQFLEVTFSIYLNRRVFVVTSVGRALSFWPGGCGFDHPPSHSKDFKTDTRYSSTCCTYTSRKHAYIHVILTPLNPCYKVKLGFTGVHIIFVITAQKHRLWILVRTASLRWF